ncbi:fungal-specific transcription factor domain-containing protein [Corynascus novoguineensis]|uniref:Fungal-specific transcription factor domain-containing protein n=1 Tax=Corynascus novoguineensis TaxID=1126955 RepID=A0AAN7D004_9PEZI|nr:fungal-specific transcription factor domain-containing protein [Corynascus novoguineensis]
MAGHDTPPVSLHSGGQDGHGAIAESSQPPPSSSKKKTRRGADPANQKRRCVSTACIACRKRKSKCDGALPSCAACASVYGTECVYDPNSDHRRKGVYREKTDSMKAKNSTLQVLIEAILNAAEEDVPAITRKIRTCDSLDAVAESILRNEAEEADADAAGSDMDDDMGIDQPVEGEKEIARKMGELRLENGSVRYFGGTSHLIYVGDQPYDAQEPETDASSPTAEEPTTSWTEVTKDRQLITHLINMYFDWHYPYFATLSKSLFYRDFLKGRPRGQPRTTVYCSPLLVNAMLALGCHFTHVAGAFAVPGDSKTKGDHFFAEAKRLIIENDEYAKPRLTTVQALALMSVREAGCGREANGWVYSGMSFRMAQDIGLNLNLGGTARDRDPLDEQEVDARRITFWGCFLFDKCWSNYLGRLPQIPKNTYNVPKYDVFPEEDAEMWSPYTDSGFDQSLKQPARTRAVGLHLSKLCEISSDLLLFFYHPNHIGRSTGKNIEIKKLSELHRRLEEWKKELPIEFEPKDGQLPHVILMHMFFHLQYIHLFKAFLKYTPATSPLPVHVSPWRMCSANAGAISKLMRLYKKLYDLRQICNIAVYMVQTACTIHILHLPEKTAKRDIIHGVKHLEEIAEDWLCARRALSTLSVLARKWKVELPEEAALVLQRTDEKYGTVSISDVPSPNRSGASATQSPHSHAGSSPNSPTISGQEQYQTPNQYGNSAAQPVTLGTPARSMPPQMVNSVASSGVSPSMQNLQNHQNARRMTQPLTTTSMSMGDPLSPISSWAVSPVTRTMPSYTQAFAPVHAHTNLGPPSSSRPNGRQVSPSSIYAVDGQDWYLKDGVNWQHNFQTWAALGTGPSQQRATQRGSNGHAGVNGPSMFVFGGVNMNGMDSGFDSMGLGNLDQLPGLE